MNGYGFALESALVILFATLAGMSLRLVRWVISDLIKERDRYRALYEVTQEGEGE